jgi:putative ABC transport system substrate-binding protein
VSLSTELARLGWVEGNNLRFEHRFVEQPDQFPSKAAELVGLRPEVIFAATTPSVAALKRATTDIPIVFAAVSDPVGTGLVSNLARPGQNITGFANAVVPLAGKWVELLKEMDPQINRVGLMFNPETAAARGAGGAQQFLAAAPAVKIEPIILEVRTTGEIEAAIESLGRAEPKGALIVTQDIFVATHRRTIIDTAAQHRVLAVYPFRFYADDGGLASYGVDVFEGSRQAATYISRILKGEHAGELPVQQPVRFELVINLKTAKTLGLPIPPTLIARADEVLE